MSDGVNLHPWLGILESMVHTKMESFVRTKSKRENCIYTVMTHG